MGPPGPPKRCLLCRRDAVPSSASLKSCATSICTIFGLPDTHPFKLIYERSQYCAPCLEEIQEADLTLGKLELIKQNILRFQNRVYSKLGDNYFQIDNREKLNLTYQDFEKGGPALKGRKFSYDEIVKVVYEKLDRDCLKWERFSSEGHLETGTSLEAEKSDNSTQTEDDLEPRRPPQIILPDINDDSAWGVGGGGGGGGDDDNGHHDDDGPCGGDDDDFETGGNSSLLNLDGSSISNRVEVIVPDRIHLPQAQGPGSSISDLMPPEVAHLFTKAPLNFDEKIFCTVDPDNCKRFFYDQYNLGVHIRSFHEGNPLPHECSVCKRGFIDEGRLKAHFLRIHSNLETFMCDQCGKGFALPQLLREHVKKKHLLAPSIFPCTFCNCALSSPGDLQEHEDKHRSLSVPFGCVFCTDSFPNSSVLRQHYSQSHGDPKFGCHVCGKLLGSESSLKNHLLLHTNTFKCELCEYTGSSKNGLKLHMLSHSTEKPHCCEYCGKSFKQARNLKAHKRMHTGEKPFGCGICGMSFREQGYLRRHEESHTEGVNYSCAECGMGFKVKENMKKHERIHQEGYVRRRWTGRTEEEKERRRQRREMVTGRVIKRRVKKEGEGTVVERRRRSPKGKKDKGKVKRSPGKGKKKVGGRKRGRKVKKEEGSEEEDGDFYEEEEEGIYGGEEEGTGGEVVMEVGEMESAIASIGGGVYGGQGQGMGITQYIPVTFVGTGGGGDGGVVRTASQLVVRRGTGQGQGQGGSGQQYPFGGGYKL